MKQKNRFWIGITAVVFLSAAFAGKDKNTIVHNPKTGTVTRHDSILFYMDPIGKVVFGRGNYSVKDISRKEIFLVRHVEYNTGQVRYNSTLKQEENVRESYYQVIFTNSNQTAEIGMTTNGNLARSFYNEGLIKNGYLDTIAQKKYILIHGNEFSKQREILIKKR